MKAVHVLRYAKVPTLALVEVPEPEIGPDEVLVEVRAAALNPVDLLLTNGALRALMPVRFPFVPGCEFAGRVAAIGSAVSGYAPGDDVIGLLPPASGGAAAQFVAVKASYLAKRPSGLEATCAAAVPLAALTARQVFDDVLKVKPQERILITGASGSFGNVAVRVALAAGLQVCVTGNARSRERFLAMGVQRYFDYRSEDFAAELSELDAVVDATGGPDFARGLGVLRRGGTLVSLRGLPNLAFARAWGFVGWKKWLCALAGARCDWAAARRGKTYRFHFAHPDGSALAETAPLFADAAHRPATHERLFDLSQASEALQTVARGGLSGKVILLP